MKRDRNEKKQKSEPDKTAPAPRTNHGAKRGDRIEFSVIAGSLKGKKLYVPDLGLTRPPLTRLRKSIFDYLNPYLEDRMYLDLFSGTGSYLFEAVSRHVTKAVGIEREQQLADAINDQAVKVGVGDRLACRCIDVFEAIPELYDRGIRFDIIMIAPPQYVDLVSKTLAVIAKYPLVNPDGIMLCQHYSSETKGINHNGFELRQHRKYGNTTYTILNGTNTKS